MPKSKGKKFYAVAKGRKTGIFQTWDDCKAQVNGFPASEFKSFKTRPEALSFLQQHQQQGGSNAASNVKQGDNRKRKEIDDSTGPTNVHPKKSRPDASTMTDASNPYSSTPIPVGTMAAAGLMFHIHFDGGARGNPGVAGAGAEIILSRATIDQSSNSSIHKATRATRRIQQSQSKTVIRRLCKTLARHYLGDNFTNNQAEYQGLISGLENVLDTLQTNKYTVNSGERVSLVVQGDSKLIIQQVKGIFECKSPKLKSYHRSAKELLKSIQKECLKQTGQPCQLTLGHVYRESNKVADCLANNAMDAKRSWTTKYEEDDENDDKTNYNNTTNNTNNTNNESDVKEDENSVPVGTRLV